METTSETLPSCPILQTRGAALHESAASADPPYFEMEIDMISNLPVIVCHQ